MWNNKIANDHGISTNELLNIWAAGQGIDGVPKPKNRKFYQDGKLTKEGLSIYQEAEDQRCRHISSQLKYLCA